MDMLPRLPRTYAPSCRFSSDPNRPKFSPSVEIPEGALPGSVEAELVLYPNLVAHVSDAIEGIMERPYGCAEQTISSAYPSLLWLQLQKSRQLPVSSLDARARHYLNLAYAKLLRYREPSGGFSLWGKGQPELSVSAYALRFLTEASEFIEVDSDVVTAARRWLLQQTAPQGGWMEKDSNGKYLEGSGLYLTAYVVEALARDLQRRKPDEKDIDAERQGVRNGIAYFSKHFRATSDPYDIALIALAKLAARDDASQEIRTLLSLERTEGETSYWDLHHNTIFYGWGYTGRIETTALVLDALAIARQQSPSSAELDRALSRGTLFLLKNKDQYGVWYSTQATVDVLQTLIRQLEAGSPDASRAPQASQLPIAESVFARHRPSPASNTRLRIGPCSSRERACRGSERGQVPLRKGSVAWRWQVRQGREPWFQSYLCSPSRRRLCCGAGPNSWFRPRCAPAIGECGFPARHHRGRRA